MSLDLTGYYGVDLMTDESQLVAIHMMAAAGLTPKRIAEALGVSVELVQTALSRHSSHDQGQDDDYN